MRYLSTGRTPSGGIGREEGEVRSSTAGLRVVSDGRLSQDYDMPRLDVRAVSKDIQRAPRRSWVAPQAHR